MAATTKSNLRAKRQEDHRTKLSEAQHLRYAVENIVKIEELEVKKDGGDNGDEIDYKDLQLNQFNLNRLKIATELRLKLVNKYLPDLKATEHTGEGGGPLQIEEWLDSLE